MTLSTTYNIGGSKYEVFEQKGDLDLTRKVGDEDQAIYYFKHSTKEGPFDKPPFDPSDWG